MMKTEHFTIDEDDIYANFYPCGNASDKAMIVMIGQNVDGLLPKMVVTYFHKQNIHVLAMSSAPDEPGYHSFPLERFGVAIRLLKEKGNKKIGVFGVSTTGMIALAAASVFPELTLTIAFTPADFVMEGFYRDKLDGVGERPGDFESSLTFEGKELPFLPYAYRHPDYWNNIKKEAKESHNLSSCIKMFEESERLHPIQEEEFVQIERIQGELVCVGCEDDCLWNAAKYIRRMKERLAKRGSDATSTMLIYRYGTHFALPSSMLSFGKKLLANILIRVMFCSGREHYADCIQVREELDAQLQTVLSRWKSN